MMMLYTSLYIYCKYEFRLSYMLSDLLDVFGFITYKHLWRERSSKITNELPIYYQNIIGDGNGLHYSSTDFSKN